VTVFRTAPAAVLDRFPYELSQTVTYLSPLLNHRLRSHLRSFDPDIILAQTQAAYLATRYGRKHGIPVLTYLHAREYLYDDYHRGSRIPARLANAVAARINRQLAHAVIERSDMLLADSRHTAEVYADHFGPALREKMEVIYEIIDPYEYAVEGDGDKILHVNPGRHKGIDLTLDVAAAMPDEEFIVIGNEGPEDVMERIRSLDNVDYRGFVDDMTGVYAETKLVLMPSKWEEPFG
ncbi:MAG: glycosyltransferase, partial [Candidatus Nanohaloarchaea archaeon]|nr:glycosyltransferase [Candidatus Nanohaloarchaea archaeon]